MANASYSGENSLSGAGAASKTSLLPFLAFGIDFFANPAVRRVIYRMELSLLASQYEVTRTERISSTINTEVNDLSHVFDQYTLQFAPQVVYNVYNAEKNQVYLSGGLSFNMSAYNKNVLTKESAGGFYGERTVVTKDPVEFKAFNFAPRVGTGLVLNKRTEISLGYCFPSATTEYVNYSVDVQRISIGLNYLFGKK